jgi:enoyl-CoA hydratase/carnithine racemase
VQNISKLRVAVKFGRSTFVRRSTIVLGYGAVMAEELQFLNVTSAGAVTTIEINKPPINLYDLALLSEFQRVAERCAYDASVHAVVVQSATPGFFIAHFDVATILQFPKGGVGSFEVRAFDRVCELFRTMPKLTIAIVEGRVGGGGSELAMSFDVRYAARETAIFNQPEVALGILPGGGGTQRLPRLIGRSRAMEVILGCEDIDADTAERWGWVNRTFAAAEVRAEAHRFAARVASFPPHAVVEAKASVLRSERGMADELVDESRAFARTLMDPAATLAMENFLARGGQTVQGESRLGELATELQ